jgi:alkylation response protein AidB-like acyl-CoA dehydrogenase
MIEQCFPDVRPLYVEARAFASQRLEQRQDDAFSRPDWRLLAQFGLFRMPFAENVGGLAMPSEDICDVLEGLGAGAANYGLLFAGGAHLWAVSKPIVDYGSPEQKATWLPGLMSGDVIGAHAASEAEAGSDVMAMKTRYRASDDGFVLTGAKMWVTNAPIADLFVVFATSDPRLHFRGISAFLIPRDTRGLSIGPPESKMGLAGAPLAEVVLDDCLVPRTALLGKERQANRIFQTSLAWERTFIQAPQIGAMRRQIERAVAYARERQQFGKPIASFQAVSHRVVGMLVRYWESRQVLRMAAEQLMHKGNATFASLAKLVLAEAALATHLDAQRTFGAAGYMSEVGIEGDVRDAIAGTIYSGTSDIQRNILAAALGLA